MGLDPHVATNSVGEAEMGALVVSDLHTEFVGAAGVVKAVDGVSFTIHRGKTLGLVGESGSGKTVLARSVMGLLPRSGVRRSGRVMFNGRDLVALSERGLRDVWGAEIGMVFQDPMTSLNPVRTVGAQVMAPMRRHLRIPRSESRRRAIALLESLHIPEPERRMKQYPHELSGGTRQRIMLAIALACRPSLLIADEPTTALDVTVQKQILALLAEQGRDRSLAILFVSHDLGVIAAQSDEVAVMYAGRIVERAPVESLFAGRHMPYTHALFESIPRIGAPSHAPIAVVSGQPPSLTNLPSGCAFAPRCAHAQTRCRVDAPPLQPLAHNREHQVACWFPLNLPDDSTNGASSRLQGSVS
jgi:oligopeptide/dipeptide ABC transporter ATP-binding protein